MSLPVNYECEGQMSIDDWLNPDLWSGKTYPEHSVQTKERISESSSKKQQKSQMRMPLFLDLRTANGHQPDSSWETAGVSPIVCTMLNGGAYHSVEKGYVWLLTSMENPQERFYLNCSEKPMREIPSRLSQILETSPDPKYNLSARACQGIINRAERRGKELPPVLKEALIRQATPLKSEGGLNEIVAENEQEKAH